MKPKPCGGAASATEPFSSGRPQAPYRCLNIRFLKPSFVQMQTRRIAAVHASPRRRSATSPKRTLAGKCSFMRGWTAAMQDIGCIRRTPTDGGYLRIILVLFELKRCSSLRQEPCYNGINCSVLFGFTHSEQVEILFARQGFWRDLY